MPKKMTTAIPPTEYNKEKGCNIVQVCSKKQNEPRLVGDILIGMLSSNSHFAKSYRSYLALKRNKGGQKHG